MNNSEWYPAIIATRKHLEELHTTVPDQSSTDFAGERIRVRPHDDADRELAKEKLFRGCKGKLLEVHPEDAERLWPDLNEYHRLAICTCAVLTD